MFTSKTITMFFSTAEEETPALTSIWGPCSHPHERPAQQPQWVPTAFLKGETYFFHKIWKKQANKYPQVLSFELKPLISFLSEQLKWFADKGSVSFFVIRLKEAGSTTKLFCSQDLFVFSAHSETSKCCVSIIGTVFSRLPIASLMAVYLRILLSSAHIREIHLVRGHYTDTFKRSGKN